MTHQHKDSPGLIQGTHPSREESFYVEWARETLKHNIEVLNSTFKLFITLDTALVSAYLGFYEKAFGCTLSVSWQALLPPLFVVLSLVTSILGIYPFPLTVNLAKPMAVKEYKERRARCKGRFLKAASVFLVLGLVALMVARVVPLPQPSTSPLPTP
jgi:hypothetical protein